MMSRTLRAEPRLLLLVAALVGGAAQATQVQYIATDLTDTTPGADLWRYDYIVKDTTFLMDEGFFVEFDFTKYRELQDPPMMVNADWSPVVFQPDAFLGDGSYDALALVDNPSLLDPFSLTFVWLGGTSATPKAQPFTVYDSSLAFVETGTTVPYSPDSAAPAPATALLLGLGLFSLQRFRKSIALRAAPPS